MIRASPYVVTTAANGDFSRKGAVYVVTVLGDTATNCWPT